MRDASALAFGTLTAWPVPPPRRVDRRVAGAAMLLAPLTQLPFLALSTLGVWVWSALHGPPAVAAVLLVAALALSSRALHLDGLADTADGLTASYDRERSLQIMRTGDVGPAGAATLVLVLLLQVTALAGLLTAGSGAALLAVVAVLASRQALALACVAGIPAADSGGLGATVAGSVGRAGAAASAGGMLLVAALPALAGIPWWAGPLTVVGAWLGAGVVVQRARRRLGGITGDILGAAVEVSLAAALTMAALAS